MVKNQPNKNNRDFYIILIVGVVAGMIVLGNLASNSIATPPIDYEYDFDLDNFSIHVEVENINNKQDGLIRETEILYFVSTITSTYNDPARVSFAANVNYAGKTSNWGSENGVPIQPGESKEFYNLISLENAGINKVVLNFEIHEDRSLTSSGGIPKTGSSLIEEKDLKFYYRVLTQSDYSYQMERKLLYQFLWISASPLVIIGVKALRDIIENKK